MPNAAGRIDASCLSRAYIDAPLVTELIWTQFPRWAELPVTPLQNGNDNRAFRLSKTMVVRLPSSEPYVAQVDKEQRWLPVLPPHCHYPSQFRFAAAPLARGIPGAGQFTVGSRDKRHVSIALMISRASGSPSPSFWSPFMQLTRTLACRRCS